MSDMVNTFSDTLGIETQNIMRSINVIVIIIYLFTTFCELLFLFAPGSTPEIK